MKLRTPLVNTKVARHVKNSFDVKYKLTVATGSLDLFFPSIPEGQISQIFRVLDEECNTEGSFKLAVRKNGHLKPTIGGDWIKFCKMRGFQERQVWLGSGWVVALGGGGGWV
ncbi:hypothetical protein Pint_19103 [Pistacia integerrima]|uniref:Uncharacterized protein n=1 Tax=Pistacia integerrima TaxID=434235 RepID=A0ACC0YUR9_9ROSI|nr:hypothetical protein Pint_19103 [Pistacia integerrima]